MNGEFAFSLGYFGKILEKIFKLSTKKSCGKRKKPTFIGSKRNYYKERLSVGEPFLISNIVEYGIVKKFFQAHIQSSRYLIHRVNGDLVMLCLDKNINKLL